MFAYNNKQYYIDIVETKPASAVSIIETDCEVDFAPPLDYKEPEKPQQPTIPASKAATEGLYLASLKKNCSCECNLLVRCTCFTRLIFSSLSVP
jgi:hypothetical protein